MKKILNTMALSACVFCLTKNVLADTKGNYIGINLTHIDVVSGMVVDQYKKDLGISYAYGLNINKFAILPELYYNFGVSSKANETYGFRMNLGFDFTPEYSLYANVGGNSSKTFSKEEAVTYGLAFRGDLNDKFSFKINFDIRDGEKNLEILSLGLSYNF